jgi:hypothetical protein
MSRPQIGNRTPPPNRFNLRTNNTSGEEIPASGLVLVADASDADDDGNYDVDKPDGTSGTYWINAPNEVPIDKPGAATNQFPCLVTYDDAETPAAGEEWGPVSGSWLLTKAGTGFRILGGPVDGLVRIEKIGGGGGGGGRTSLLKATDTIPGREVDLITGIQPGEGTDFDVIDGDEPVGAIKNWSTVAIQTDAYMITVQIGDFDVIVNAFC